MSFQVQVRKDDDTIQGAKVRIEYAGGSDEGTTDADGFVTFDYDRSGPAHPLPERRAPEHLRLCRDPERHDHALKS